MPRVDPATLEHLDEHGYVAIASAASEAELQTARGLLWEFLEAHLLRHPLAVGHGPRGGRHVSAAAPFTSSSS